jgi:hypothetical protein
MTETDNREELLNLLEEQIIDVLNERNIRFIKINNEKSASKYYKLLYTNKIIRISDHIGKVGVCSININGKPKAYREFRRKLRKEEEKMKEYNKIGIIL